MFRTLILGACLLLSGCWLGAPFYSASEARPAFPAGIYLMTGIPGSESEGPSRMHVSLTPEGMTRIMPVGDEGDASLWGFARLPGGGGHHIAWLAQIEDQPMAGRILYGLLARKDGGAYRLLIPDCESSKALAISAGAALVPEPDRPTCLFKDRATLETGLRALIPQVEEGLHFVPAGE